MQKVSRTMLAVVAAIQSGAHTRRKPKYIKEQALVSFLYPYTIAEALRIKMPALSSVEVVKTKVGLEHREGYFASLPILASVIIREPIVRYSAGSEVFSANLPLLASAVVKSTKINYNYGAEPYTANLPSLISVETRKVVVPTEHSENANFNLPSVLSVKIN